VATVSGAQTNTGCSDQQPQAPLSLYSAHVRPSITTSVCYDTTTGLSVCLFITVKTLQPFLPHPDHGSDLSSPRGPIIRVRNPTHSCNGKSNAAKVLCLGPPLCPTPNYSTVCSNLQPHPPTQPKVTHLKSTLPAMTPCRAPRGAERSCAS
jgi:hypothetical protein